jgi:hypothetical protein
MANLNIYRRTLDGFAPASDDAALFFGKTKLGQLVTLDGRRPRNLKFHRKFFALIDYVFSNQDRYANKEDLRVELELKAGSYREHVTTKGKLVYVPKSIAFDKMDDVEFEQLYNRVIDVVLKHFVRGDTKENIDEQVNNILGYA